MPLFRQSSPLPDVIFDVHMGDPKRLQLDQIALARDWLALEFFFEQIDNWDDQAHYIDAFSSIPRTEKWLFDLNQGEADGTLAPLLLAARRIRLGVEGIRPGRIGREQVAAFLAELAVAEEILDEITEVEPDNAAAWAFRIQTARLLRLGRAEAQRRYEIADSLGPHNLTAQHWFLRELSPAARGSAQQMHSFARQAAESAPPGGGHGGLVAIAHIEHYFHQGPLTQDVYMRRVRTVDELHAAAERSVVHADYGGPRALLGYSIFALAFFLAGQHSAAAELFDRMGSTGIHYPWSFYYPNAEEAFLWAREVAHRKGRSMPRS